MKPVKLSELIDALEFESDEYVCRVDLLNGTVVRVERSLLYAAEDGNEDALENRPDWEQADAEIAKAIAADSGKRFVAAPDKFGFHEYRQMERFIGSVEDRAAAEELGRAIRGKGAFRYFKDTAARLGLLKQWYQHRDNALEQYARDWAEAHQVPVEDDTTSRPKG
ncbi:MAG: hypothetical protein FJ399_21805 [Verrucomicrobia bacterium]|nr:hypothetical protein [Verrucomicrobiota bacterium]